MPLNSCVQIARKIRLHYGKLHFKQTVTILFIWKRPWWRLCLVLTLFKPAWAVSLEGNNENVPFHYAAEAGICCACELQKGHCYWVTPKVIFNDKNKGEIRIIVDKFGRVKTKQWESAASVFFFFFCPLLQFPLLFSELCVHPDGFSLQPLY